MISWYFGSGHFPAISKQQNNAYLKKSYWHSFLFVFTWFTQLVCQNSCLCLTRLNSGHGQNRQHMQMCGGNLEGFKNALFKLISKIFNCSVPKYVATQTCVKLCLVWIFKNKGRFHVPFNRAQSSNLANLHLQFCCVIAPKQCFLLLSYHATYSYHTVWISNIC